MAAGFLAASVLLATAVPAAATITSGDCTGGATGTRSGTVDFAKSADWTVYKDDVVSGHGEAKADQTSMSAWVVLFGVASPPFFQNTPGKTRSGTAGPFKIADFARYGRVVAVAGKSNDCAGDLRLIISDESPFTNLISIVGEVLMGIGLLGLLGLLFAGGGCAARFFGLLLGLLFGIGAGVLLVELSVLDPRSLVGLAAPAAGALAGAVLPGLLHHGAAAVSPPPAST